MTTASAYGWYVFSPLDFTVQWDGTDVIWTYQGADAWFPLATAQYPGFSEFFDRVAPERIKGFSPPFLTSTAQPGILQVWTGLFVRTAPNWSLLVRSLANLPRSHVYELYEGIVETDHWFGPLFMNLRLTRPDYPIQFGTELPLFQIQPLPRICYSEESQRRVRNIEPPMSFSDEDWAGYEETIVRPNIDPERKVGRYAAAARKRDKQNR